MLLIFKYGFYILFLAIVSELIFHCIFITDNYWYRGELQIAPPVFDIQPYMSTLTVVFWLLILSFLNGK